MKTDSMDAYTGSNIPCVIQDPNKKEAYRLNWKQLYINYGDNVDFQRLSRQILLCGATEEKLYEPPAPVGYVRGSRPQLEKTVSDVCVGCGNDRRRVIALMCFCRDLYKVHGEQLFYGGTEEELIKKGEGLCECLGRLMVVLCEVAGIPGRIVMQICAGHIISELYFEGKWGYVDPRCGLFYLKKDGSFASVSELVHDRGIIRNQSDDVRNYVSDLWTYEQRADRNYNACLHPAELQCFCNYSLMDSEEYHFQWKSVSNAEKDGLSMINKRYIALSKIIFELPD